MQILSPFPSGMSGTKKHKRRTFVLEPLEERVQLSTMSPASVSLGAGSLLASTKTQTVPLSITLPPEQVDIALLLDDTGSFDKQFGQTLDSLFAGMASSLQANFPNVSFGFGVARFEDYGGPGTVFSQDLKTASPYLLDQPIVTAATAAAHGTSLDSLMATAFGEIGQGNGGDTPEPDFEALYQIATGAGFDGNGDGSNLQSGPAGSLQAATNAGTSGDVPAFFFKRRHHLGFAGGNRLAAGRRAYRAARHGHCPGHRVPERYQSRHGHNHRDQRRDRTGHQCGVDERPRGLCQYDCGFDGHRSAAGRGSPGRRDRPGGGNGSEQPWHPGHQHGTRC